MNEASKQLFVQDLGVGDLVQLSGIHVHENNNHGVVVGYILEEFGVPSAIYVGHTFSFRYIPNGTLAIYLGRSVEARVYCTPKVHIPRQLWYERGGRIVT